MRRNPRRQHIAPPGIAKPKPRNLDRLAGKYHAHGCAQCSRRYCDNCQTPAINGRCRDCTGALHGRSTWDIGGDPEPCCRQHAVPATAEQMTIHNCAGNGDWWICLRCHRTHPYNPRSTS